MMTLRSFLRAVSLALVVVTWATTLASAQQPTDGSSTAASVLAVRYHVEPGRTRIWFETSGTVLYTQYSPDPLTLVIDLPGADVSGVAERTVVGSREVESIAVRRLQSGKGKNLARVEVKLAAVVPYEVTASEHAVTIVLNSQPEAEPKSEPADAAETPTEPAGPTPPSVDTAPDQDVSAPIVAAEIPAGEPEPVPVEPTNPATTIQKVHHTVSGGVLKITVGADGRLNYTSFRLDGPKRVVFDFNGVLNAVTRSLTSIEALGVQKMRIAQFRTASPRITRLVFDVDKDVPFRAVERGESLDIYFAPTAAELERVAPTQAAMAPVASSRSSSGGGGNGQSHAPSAPDGEASTEAGASLEPVAVVAQNFAPGAPVEPGSLPSLPEPPQETPPVDAEHALPASFEGQTLGVEEKVYTGELISLDFKDGDIQDIFRLFADISGLNIVVQPGVTGKVTLKLTEVPWDQALELILKTHKLGYTVEGNVVRIAPLSELANEEAERRRLDEERALAGELDTLTRQLSYAKANDVQALLRKNLSPRGDISIDPRTNTLIITDLPARLTDINALIATLDTAIPGVEIEARVVVTTRSFSRAIGIQWGFTGYRDPMFGNQTELTFPNKVLVDGQSIGSDVIEEFKTTGPITGGGSGGARPPQVGSGSAQRGYAVNLPMATAPTGAVGISLGSITGAFSIDAALMAAEAEGEVRILSAPRVITQNNKAATIKQGVTFPVQVVANNTVTVQFKDAVLELTVTPQITSASTIILDIQVNNDEADFSRQVNGIPTIITQNATTQVLMADGTTTVIGGVFKNTVDERFQYVPLLHKIPFLGYLFKNSTKNEENRELLIFMTPRIRKDAPVGT